MNKPTILVTEGGDAKPMAWLRERADVLDVGPDDEGFEAAVARADGMVVRSYTNVTAELLAHAKHLKVVGRGGVGLESIDVAACQTRGIEVVYTPDANTRAVAEFVSGLAVKLVRPWHANALDFTNDGFKILRQDAGEHLADLTIGILGMGRVGRAVTRVFEQAHGASVVYYDVADVSAAVRDDGLAATPIDFERLLTTCDLLSIHVDGRAGNRHLIDGGAIVRGSFRYLINTSRGLVLDAAALPSALASGRLSGVAIDVYDPEPPTPDSPYATLQREHADRVILTPHMASRTKVATENMSWVVRDVLAVCLGQTPTYPAPPAST